jgi:hypothetical protein
MIQTIVILVTAVLPTYEQILNITKLFASLSIFLFVSSKIVAAVKRNKE